MSVHDASNLYGKFGRLVVIKKKGNDGHIFCLDKECTFGRHTDCDIQMKIDVVSRRHAKVLIDEQGQAWLHVLSSNPTYLNDIEVKEPVLLSHEDVIGIGGRYIRYEAAPITLSPETNEIDNPLEFSFQCQRDDDTYALHTTEIMKVLTFDETSVLQAISSTSPISNNAEAVVVNDSNQSRGSLVTEPQQAQIGLQITSPVKLALIEPNAAVVRRRRSSQFGGRRSVSISSADCPSLLSLRSQLLEVNEKKSRKSITSDDTVTNIRCDGEAAPNKTPKPALSNDEPTVALPRPQLRQLRDADHAEEDLTISGFGAFSTLPTGDDTATLFKLETLDSTSEGLFSTNIKIANLEHEIEELQASLLPQSSQQSDDSKQESESGNSMSDPVPFIVNVPLPTPLLSSVLVHKKRKSLSTPLKLPFTIRTPKIQKPTRVCQSTAKKLKSKSIITQIEEIPMRRKSVSFASQNNTFLFDKLKTPIEIKARCSYRPEEEKKDIEKVDTANEIAELLLSPRGSKGILARALKPSEVQEPPPLLSPITVKQTKRNTRINGESTLDATQLFSPPPAPQSPRRRRKVLRRPSTSTEPDTTTESSTQPTPEESEPQSTDATASLEVAVDESEEPEHETETANDEEPEHEETPVFVQVVVSPRKQKSEDAGEDESLSPSTKETEASSSQQMEMQLILMDNKSRVLESQVVVLTPVLDDTAETNNREEQISSPSLEPVSSEPLSVAFDSAETLSNTICEKVADSQESLQVVSSESEENSTTTTAAETNENEPTEVTTQPNSPSPTEDNSTVPTSLDSEEVSNQQTSDTVSSSNNEAATASEVQDNGSSDTTAQNDESESAETATTTANTNDDTEQEVVQYQSQLPVDEQRTAVKRPRSNSFDVVVTSPLTRATKRVCVYQTSTDTTSSSSTTTTTEESTTTTTATATTSTTTSTPTEQVTTSNNNNDDANEETTVDDPMLTPVRPRVNRTQTTNEKDTGSSSSSSAFIFDLAPSLQFCSPNPYHRRSSPASSSSRIRRVSTADSPAVTASPVVIKSIFGASPARSTSGSPMMITPPPSSVDRRQRRRSGLSTGSRPSTGSSRLSAADSDKHVAKAFSFNEESTLTPFTTTVTSLSTDTANGKTDNVKADDATKAPTAGVCRRKRRTVQKSDNSVAESETQKPSRKPAAKSTKQKQQQQESSSSSDSESSAEEKSSSDSSESSPAPKSKSTAAKKKPTAVRSTKSAATKKPTKAASSDTDSHDNSSESDSESSSDCEQADSKKNTTRKTAVSTVRKVPRRTRVPKPKPAPAKESTSSSSESDSESHKTKQSQSKKAPTANATKAVEASSNRQTDSSDSDQKKSEEVKTTATTKPSTQVRSRIGKTAIRSRANKQQETNKAEATNGNQQVTNKENNVSKANAEVTEQNNDDNKSAGETKKAQPAPTTATTTAIRSRKARITAKSK